MSLRACRRISFLEGVEAGVVRKDFLEEVVFELDFERCMDFAWNKWTWAFGTGNSRIQGPKARRSRLQAGRMVFPRV